MNIETLHICSLEAARELDVSVYDGVITIEDTTIEEPFRVEDDGPQQLVLRFDDISVPMDGYVEPDESHIHAALAFAYKIAKDTGGSILIHCHAGISRSSAIALAIIAQRLGRGKEEEAVHQLEMINPNCRPNKSLVWMTDEILKRDRKLYDKAYEMVWLTN
jgi:predicted protein tyrosine phosphatase